MNLFVGRHTRHLFTFTPPNRLWQARRIKKLGVGLDPATRKSEHIPNEVFAANERGSIMTNRGLLTTGIVGTIIAALCCFTPLLVVLLSAVGLSARLGWLDFVLLPALGIFILITVYAGVRYARHSSSSTGG